MTVDDNQLTGGCACGEVRYELTAKPLFVHCCHCRLCQRQTGSAFVLNALIEMERVELTGALELVDTPGPEDGRSQQIARCTECRVAVYSHYRGKTDLAFIRVGTLDDPDSVPPDIHIWTMSKQPWVTLSDDVPVMQEYYRASEQWPKESLERVAALRSKA